jgi:hypothetical protein
MSWLAAGVMATTSAGAHHSFGSFQMDVDIELEGTVTKLDFVNPHSWLHFDVSKDGKTESYRCEMRSATTLRRSGWTPEMFKPGTKLTIQGSPDRNDPHACYVSTIVFADGSELDRYGQRIEAKPVATQRAARLPSGEPNITGDWAQEQLVMTDSQGRDGTLVPLSQVDKFERGGVPEGQREIPGARGTPEAAAGGLAGTRPPPRSAVALTAAGQAAMEKLASMSRAERSCMVGSILSDWGGEGVNRITQSGNTIKLEYGRNGLERTIHLGMAAHPANVTPTRAGHSIGKWDNDVLVVDTVGFLPGALTGVTPHSDKLHVVERFTLDPATMMLKREYTAEDPEYLTEKYSRSDTVEPSIVPYAPEPCEDLSVTAP